MAGRPMRLEEALDLGDVDVDKEQRQPTSLASRRRRRRSATCLTALPSSMNTAEAAVMKDVATVTSPARYTITSRTSDSLTHICDCEREKQRGRGKGQGQGEGEEESEGGAHLGPDWAR